MQTVIDVQHVSMKFNLMEEKVDTLKEYVVRLLKGKLLYNEFLALKDVSFTVQKGDIVGIVGFNGAGKSTMLKLLAGVLTPTMFADLSACGGVLTIVAGMRVSGIKQYPIANMIPALLLVLPASAIWQTLMV